VKVSDYNFELKVTDIEKAHACSLQTKVQLYFSITYSIYMHAAIILYIEHA